MDEDEDTETPTSEAGEEVEDVPEAEETPSVDAPEQTADEAAESDTGTEDPAVDEASEKTAEEKTAEEKTAEESDAEFEWTAADSDATDSDAAETPVGDDLVERVSAVDEELGAEVETLIQRAFELKDEAETLRETVEDLEAERDDLRDEREDLKQRLVRKQADFKNYKERAKKKQEQIQERATEDLVERIVPVRDNLVRALGQDEGADIRDGVEATLREFDRVLEDENVEEVAPTPGAEVDPQRHEVMVRVDSAEPEGAIVDVYRPGYEMGGKVIQTAQVTVSNGSDYDDSDEAVALGGEVEEAQPASADSPASDGGEVDEESGESAESTDDEVSEAIGGEE
ncbi:nucleotide exchange factor GrpE [Haloarchaeobius sp. DT45]|uniref:nucleotide exchange factor GrpE n=1 Tax=Haloarchaeobius sp. DT45 TaxID=3446116 RepID=UPI003F6C7C19